MRAKRAQQRAGRRRGNGRWWRLGAVLAVAVGVVPRPLWAQGYRLGADRVEVSTQAQWEAWQRPAGVAYVSPAGEVRPAYLPASVDATDDAASFSYRIAATVRNQFDTAFDEGGVVKARGGVKKVGSNRTAAARAIDGDPATYWEPLASDPLENWWLEVDLGRLVTATKVVVRFADDAPTDRADPMLQFRVHSATGQSPFGAADQSGTLDYVLVGGTSMPNKTQRVFEFDLQPQGSYSSGWTGRVLQYLRVAATASDGDRAELLTREQYERLGAADRGTVEYVWRIGGEERLVTAQRYGELPPGEQGGIRYWRRERPKLAEIEVWTVGVNVALGVLERGGSFTDRNSTAFPERAFDGLVTTDWGAIVYSTVGDIAGWGLLTIDLGALYRVNAVRTITRVLGSGQAALYGYELRGSDGSRAPDGSLIWQALSGEERQLNQGTRLFADEFAPRPLRYVEFRNVDVARRTRAHEGHRYPSIVSEMQIYAVGYVPEVVMTSGFVDLQRSRNLMAVTWDADVPAGTGVQVRTRTGDELREVIRYFNAQGQELANKEAWDRLPSFARGPTIKEVLAGSGWSNWSQAQLASGEPVRSPSPRRYLELEVRLRTDDPATAPVLRALNVHFVDPVAASVKAEIHPKREVPLAEPVDFALYVLPEYAAGNPRVDLVRLIAPARAALVLAGLSRGTPAALAAGTATQFVRGEDGRWRDSGGRALAVAGDGTDTLDVRLPAVLAHGELARLSFTTAVYQSGSTFAVAVGNSGRAGVWQLASAGDAAGDELAPGEGMTVLTPLGGASLRLVAGGPRVVTPNGDGVNDVVSFEFTVVRINAERRIEVQIYDLGGRLVRRLVETRAAAAGLYAVPWDGTDGAGERVPPGLYVARIVVASDAAAAQAAASVVHVVY